ncbi:MAG TPA: PfkB family carbohydrate kinase [Thermoplasmata archaeon]|nr:PfkB family carbohydrate kinase [Thermoplasmata archaeon]
MAAGGARRDLLVAGHVVVDRYLSVARFPRADRTEPVVAERSELGGTATTVARVAARLGLSVGILSRVGDGFPATFRDDLARDGIDLRGLTCVAGTPTPTCTIVEGSDRATRMLFQQGPMGSARGASLPGGWWRSYRWLHLGTGDPRFYLRLARAARKARQHVAVDPAQEILYRWDRPTFLSLLPFADILFGNRAEIARATAWAGGRSPARLLERVPLVVRTEGPGGATAFYRGGSVHVGSRRPRRTRTLVGAGDAFRGGFYGAWFAGEPLARCVAAGNREALARIEGAT